MRGAEELCVDECWQALSDDERLLCGLMQVSRLQLSPRGSVEPRQALRRARTSRSQASRGAIVSSQLLTAKPVSDLQRVLNGRLITVCFGAGVDSTAMLMALHAAEIEIGAITFANTGNEKPETLRHVEAMREELRWWGWPDIEIATKYTKPSTGYTNLLGNCLQSETLPIRAFGMKTATSIGSRFPKTSSFEALRAERGSAHRIHFDWKQRQEASES